MPSSATPPTKDTNSNRVMFPRIFATTTNPAPTTARLNSKARHISYPCPGGVASDLRLTILEIIPDLRPILTSLEDEFRRNRHGADTLRANVHLHDIERDPVTTVILPGTFEHLRAVCLTATTLTCIRAAWNQLRKSPLTLLGWRIGPLPKIACDRCRTYNKQQTNNGFHSIPQNHSGLGKAQQDQRGSQIKS